MPSSLVVLRRVLGLVLLAAALGLTPARVELVGFHSAGGPGTGRHHDHHDAMAAGRQHRSPASDLACAQWCALQCASMSDVAGQAMPVRPGLCAGAPLVLQDEAGIGVTPDPAVPPPRSRA